MQLDKGKIITNTIVQLGFSFLSRSSSPGRRRYGHECRRHEERQLGWRNE